MAKKDKKTKTKVGIKKQESAKVEAVKKTPPGKPPKRIRMLVSCANQYKSYTMGHSYKVPQKISVDIARSWIGSGIAEEDKSLAGVPEEKK